MLPIKLAFKNLLSAGTRTWLNAISLSFVMVMIIFYSGMLDGWQRDSARALQEYEIGQGQLWHPRYDNLDPNTIPDAHQRIDSATQRLIAHGVLTPVLIYQGSVYPEGRMQNIVIRGVDPMQQLLKLPTSILADPDMELPVLVGEATAREFNLQQGDMLLLRWRDKYGAFDAREVTIAAIVKSDVATVDRGVLFMSLEHLYDITGLDREATLLVCRQRETVAGWEFKSVETLMSDINQIIATKRVGSMVMEMLLLVMALLVVFDTQVLSIFRRQKEIGTYIALGMTPRSVVWIFATEGVVYSLFAALLTALYGTPLFVYLYHNGIALGMADMGMGITEVLYPYYSFQTIVYSLSVIVVATTIVSYLPARRISRMSPTDALRGKLI